ncbi:MAG: alpha/beta fold hydrolase [Chloroflexi bacterium]|nr:alpha/beta fold hydrolase [Chloroflexota bacterium]
MIAFVTTGCATSNNFREFPLEDSELAVLTTQDGVEYVRTSDIYFENLPDWPYEVKYVEINGLRQAYYETGPADGEVVLLLHGQPTWSYLYRKMIHSLANAGYRVIAMDHLGMGRSDKPIDLDYYSYMLHVERLEAFIQELELDDEGITVFLQDWGSVIGLNVVGNHPDWFDRVVLGNGSLPEWPDGFEPIPSIETYTQEEIQESLDLINSKIAKAPAVQPQRRDENGELVNDTNGGHDLSPIRLLYTRSDERFRVSLNIEAGTFFALTPEEHAAFEAPFPARVTMASTRVFPSLISQWFGQFLNMLSRLRQNVVSEILI